MSKRIAGVDDAARFTLPQEAIEALGLQPGDEVDIEIVRRAVVVRSVADAEPVPENSAKASRASCSVGAAPMTNWLKAQNNAVEFPDKLDVLAIHARLIAETGGSMGLRDEGVLESAVVAAENRQH